MEGGHNGWMPSFVVEYPPLDVAGSIGQRVMLSHPVRAEVIRYLMSKDHPVLVPEIAEAINVNYHATLRHVKALVDLGVVAKAAGNERGYLPIRETVIEKLLESVSYATGRKFVDVGPLATEATASSTEEQ